MVSIDMKKIVCIQILLWMSCLINVSAQDSYKEYEQKVYVSSRAILCNIVCCVRKWRSRVKNIHWYYSCMVQVNEVMIIGSS